MLFDISQTIRSAGRSPPNPSVGCIASENPTEATSTHQPGTGGRQNGIPYLLETRRLSTLGVPLSYAHFNSLLHSETFPNTLSGTGIEALKSQEDAPSMTPSSNGTSSTSTPLPPRTAETDCGRLAREDFFHCLQAFADLKPLSPAAPTSLGSAAAASMDRRDTSGPPIQLRRVDSSPLQMLRSSLSVSESVPTREKADSFLYDGRLSPRGLAADVEQIKMLLPEQQRTPHSSPRYRALSSSYWDETTRDRLLFNSFESSAKLRQTPPPPGYEGSPMASAAMRRELADDFFIPRPPFEFSRSRPSASGRFRQTRESEDAKSVSYDQTAGPFRWTHPVASAACDVAMFNFSPPPPPTSPPTAAVRTPQGSPADFSAETDAITAILDIAAHCDADQGASYTGTTDPGTPGIVSVEDRRHSYPDLYSAPNTSTGPNPPAHMAQLPSVSLTSRHVTESRDPSNTEKRIEASGWLPPFLSYPSDEVRPPCADFADVDESLADKIAFLKSRALGMRDHHRYTDLASCRPSTPPTVSTVHTSTSCSNHLGSGVGPDLPSQFQVLLGSLPSPQEVSLMHNDAASLRYSDDRNNRFAAGKGASTGELIRTAAIGLFSDTTVGESLDPLSPSMSSHLARVHQTAPASPAPPPLLTTSTSNTPTSTLTRDVVGTFHHSYHHVDHNNRHCHYPAQDARHIANSHRVMTNPFTPTGSCSELLGYSTPKPHQGAFGVSAGGVGLPACSGSPALLDWRRQLPASPDPTAGNSVPDQLRAFLSSLVPHHLRPPVSPPASHKRRVYSDDRDRMVYISWIPKKGRAYNTAEKRKMELELKHKLREMGLVGLTKVLLFPPKGVHCKLIFDSRASAALFMKRYGGENSSPETESWKSDMCQLYAIDLHEKFEKTVVKIEWSQK